MTESRAQQLPEDDTLLGELVVLARSRRDYGLHAFRSVVAARQYRTLYDLVRQYIPDGATVLDWGAGNGHFSYYMMRRGYRVSGFSFAVCPLMTERYAESYPLVLGDEKDPITIPFADQSFDAVASVGVLEHVQEVGGNAIGSLREIRRVLKPGGHFLCVHLPNRRSWIERLSRLLGSKHHLFPVTTEEIHGWLEAAQFDPLHCKRYGFLPRNFWGRVPRSVGDARISRIAWDGIDSLFSATLRRYCQNYAVVAQRPIDN